MLKKELFPSEMMRCLRITSLESNLPNSKTYEGDKISIMFNSKVEMNTNECATFIEVRSGDIL